MSPAWEALLVLEDGTAFRGEAFTAAPATVAGEVVFNTAMGGYQGGPDRSPSYAGQLVTMAAPEVGTATAPPRADAESDKVQVAAFLVRQAARRPSSWRAERSLAEELEAAGVPGVEGLDTRRLVRHLRQRGAARRPLDRGRRPRAAARARPGRLDPNGLAMVDQVTRAAPVELPADGDEHLRVVLYDFGARPTSPGGCAGSGPGCGSCRPPPRPPRRWPGAPTG